MNIFKQIATLGPIGYLPAPGTAATLCTVPVVIALQHIVPTWYGIIAFTSCVIALFVIQRALPFFATQDPSEIVLDEAVATLAIFYALPHSILVYAAGVVLFRFFDITKYAGVRLFERLPGAYGVLCDDLWAAFLTWSILQIGSLWLT